MTRASTWTNSDGLVVGFGRNTPELAGGVTVDNVIGSKVSAVHFSYADINAASAISAPVPAGSRVLSVRLKVHDAWAGAANALIVGDGGATNGYITTTNGAVANLTAGASIVPDGVYAFATTDTTAPELKVYASADTIDVASADTDWTAGTATLEVVYI